MGEDAGAYFGGGSELGPYSIGALMDHVPLFSVVFRVLGKNVKDREGTMPEGVPWGKPGRPPPGVMQPRLLLIGF